MGDVSKKVGKRIKEIRELRGMKQFVLAEKLNMEPSNLTRIESGCQLPKEENLLKIAKNLNVEIKDLFDFPDNVSKDEMIKNIYNILYDLDDSKVEFLYKLVKLYVNSAF